MIFGEYNKQKKYFEEQGINAWVKGDIPFDITTNSAYANQLKELSNEIGKDLNILEIGAGSGLFGINYMIQNSLNTNKYIVSDYSSQTIQDLKNLKFIRENNKLQVKYIDVLKTQIPGKYDLIILNYVLCNLPESKIQETISMLMKKLTPRGIILVSDSTINNNSISNEKYGKTVFKPLYLDDIKSIKGVKSIDNEHKGFPISSMIIGRKIDTNIADKFKKLFIENNQNIELFKQLKEFYKLYGEEKFEESFEIIKQVLKYRDKDVNILYRYFMNNKQLGNKTSFEMISNINEFDHYNIFSKLLNNGK